MHLFLVYTSLPILNLSERTLYRPLTRLKITLPFVVAGDAESEALHQAGVTAPIFEDADV